MSDAEQPESNTSPPPPDPPPPPPPPPREPPADPSWIKFDDLRHNAPTEDIERKLFNRED